MMETLNNICLAVTDPVLGWLLSIPRDVAMILIAVGTSALLTFVRPWTTNQDLLGRCDADKKKLNALMKQAKAAGDKEALARYRASQSAIAMKLMRAEGKPLLVAILPIALLATWAFNRVAFYPPKGGEPVTVNAFFPASSIGHLAHMVPQPGVRAERWIARVRETDNAIPGQEGEAVWTVRAEARPQADYELAVRYRGRDYPVDLRVGARDYAPNTRFYSGPGDRITASEVALKPFRLFGVLHVPWGQIDAFFPPWMLAYLVIAIPCALAMKPLFGIH